jgi:hypothetical protein
LRGKKTLTVHYPISTKLSPLSNKPNFRNRLRAWINF